MSLGCSLCGYVVEFGRGCYRSKWNLPGHGLVTGRFWFAFENAPVYPHEQWLGSRNWHFGDGSPWPTYGETQSARQFWVPGTRPPIPPRAIQIGTGACIGSEVDGDTTTPNRGSFNGIDLRCYNNNFQMSVAGGLGGALCFGIFRASAGGLGGAEGISDIIHFGPYRAGGLGGATGVSTIIVFSEARAGGLGGATGVSTIIVFSEARAGGLGGAKGVSTVSYASLASAGGLGGAKGVSTVSYASLASAGGLGGATGASSFANGDVSCANCSGGTGRYYMNFTLAGLTNGTCSNCSSYNRTYKLSPGTTCQWTETFSSTCTGGSTDTARIQMLSSTSAILFVAGATYSRSGTWDCKSPATFSFSTGTGVCNNLPSTISVTPSAS